MIVDTVARVVRSFNMPFHDERAWTPAGVFASRMSSILGRTLSEDEILYCSVVWACVTGIADTVSSLRQDVKREYEDGSKEIDKKHYLNRVLRRPNPWMSSFEYEHLANSRVMLWGAHYAEIARDGNTNTGYLYPMHPSRMQEKWDADRKEMYYEYTYVNGGKDTFEWWQIHKIIGPSKDGFRGMSIGAAAMDAINLYKLYEEYCTAYFENDTTPPFFISKKGLMSKDERKEFREEFQKTMGRKNRGRFGLLWGDMVASPMNVLSNRDAQLSEQQRRVIEDIARYFKYPLHKLGVHDHSTFSNVENLELQYKTTCIFPIVIRNQQAKERDLLKPYEEGKIHVEYDLRDLQAADTKSIAEATAALVMGSVMKVNEARKSVGLNPTEGGDIVLQPLAHGPLGTKPVEKEQKREEPPALEERQIEQAFKFLFDDAAQRCFNKQALAVRRRLEKQQKDPAFDVRKAESEFFEKHLPEVREIFHPHVYAFALLTRTAGKQAERFLDALERSYDRYRWRDGQDVDQWLESRTEFANRELQALISLR